MNIFVWYLYENVETCYLSFAQIPMNYARLSTSDKILLVCSLYKPLDKCLLKFNKHPPISARFLSAVKPQLIGSRLVPFFSVSFFL